MSTAEILDAALSLDLRQRGRLIAALIQSLEVEGSRPFENASQAELLRRLAAVQAGKSTRRSSAAVGRSALERLRKLSR